MLVAMLAILWRTGLQLVFLTALGYTSHSLGQRYFTSAPLPIRWSAQFIAYCWLLSLLFSILAPLHLFAPVPAVLASLAVGVAAYVLPSSTLPSASTTFFANDFARGKEVLREHAHDAIVGRVTTLCVLLLSALLAIRILALPILGWDSLTYHALKAGLWVQSRGWFALEAPGGWEYYRSFLGGGEVFTSWAMLFLHADILAGLPDLGFWLFLGLVCVCVAHLFGSSLRTSLLIAAAFLCSPALSGAVGSGYVDNCGSALLLGGFTFMLRGLQSKQLSDFAVAAASFGLAASTKLTMLFVSLCMMPALIALMVANPRRCASNVVLCGILFLVPVVPWLLYNYLSTGYPLGSISLKIGAVKVGEAPPNLVWFLDRPDLVPYTFATEGPALLSALSLWGFSLLLSVLGAVGMFLEARRERARVLLTGWLIASVTAFYFSPSFSIPRILWAPACGRFLIPIVLLTAAAGCQALEKVNRGWTRAVGAISVLSSVIGLLYYVLYYVVAFSLRTHLLELVFLGLAVALSALLYSPSPMRMCFSRIATLVAKPTYAFFIVAGAIVGIAEFRGRVRNQAYAHSMIMDDFPRYWTPALVALDSEPQPLRIAFTYGPRQTSHRAFLTPFLGKDLANRLFYVSPERDGRVLPHHPEQLAKSQPDVEVWMASLRSVQATHLLCLAPPSVELKWAENRPNMFTRLAGKAHEWGLFRIERFSPPR